MLLPFLLLALCATLSAQTVVSPEIAGNGDVTFRAAAPQAREVALFGDWMKPNTTLPMKRDSAGVWAVTLPLPQGMYIYHFLIDGMTIADPVNPRIKLRARTSASLVEVPGDRSSFWQPRDVPHGSVEIQWRRSAVLGGETRWVWIYTPPGYASSAKRYPVLYLFHGSNDIAGGWVLAGNANFILDNLIAEKKAQPMIIVMPFGHAVPFGSPKEIQAKNTSVYEQYLFQEVIPMVEQQYRTQPHRSRRAIAGLSMGGGQSLEIGTKHLDAFGAIGAFSAAVPAGLAVRAEEIRKAKPLLWFACGKDDFLYQRSVDLDAALTAAGVTHTWVPTGGAHTYTVWREYLRAFAPLLFQ